MNIDLILLRIAVLYEDSLYNYKDLIVNNIVNEPDDTGYRVITINGSEDHLIGEFESNEERYKQSFIEEVEKVLREEVYGEQE